MANKIMIVDDEEHIRKFYAEELNDEGYPVVTVSTGFKLLERIEKEDPDLVILDIKIREYNGLELLQDIKNKFCNLPVGICSAYDTFKNDMKSVAADFYVVRSFDLTELKNSIARTLNPSEKKGINYMN